SQALCLSVEGRRDRLDHFGREPSGNVQPAASLLLSRGESLHPGAARDRRGLSVHIIPAGSGPEQVAQSELGGFGAATSGRVEPWASPVQLPPGLGPGCSNSFRARPEPRLLMVRTNSAWPPVWAEFSPGPLPTISRRSRTLPARHCFDR